MGIVAFEVVCDLKQQGVHSIARRKGINMDGTSVFRRGNLVEKGDCAKQDCARGTILLRLRLPMTCFDWRL
jgi:hypothetical protein